MIQGRGTWWAAVYGVAQSWTQLERLSSSSISSNDSNLNKLLLSSVQFSRSVVSDSLRPHESQHARHPCPSTNSRSLLKLMPIELVMPFSHLTLLSPPSPSAPNPSQHQGLFQ